MVITNKHVGWGIVILLLLAPWFPVLFGQGVFGEIVQRSYGPFRETTVMGTIRGLEVIFGGIAAVIATGRFVGRLFDGDIEFEWKVPLGRKEHSKDHTKALLHKLHELPQDSKEWEYIYNELDKKGQWG